MATPTWSRRTDAARHYAAFGKPMPTGFAQSFNGRSRDEVLGISLSHSLHDTRRQIGASVVRTDGASDGAVTDADVWGDERHAGRLTRNEFLILPFRLSRVIAAAKVWHAVISNRPRNTRHPNGSRERGVRFSLSALFHGNSQASSGDQRGLWGNETRNTRVHRLKDNTSQREYGALGRIRTPDPLIRSQVLYPTELPARAAAV